MKFFDIVWAFCLKLADSPFLFSYHSTVVEKPLQQVIEDIDLDIENSKTLWHSPVWQDADCNGPSNRREWCDYTIRTDYELLWPYTGVVRQYTLNLTNDFYFGDGYNATCMLINGSYPGPILEGNWGDVFNITVHNNLEIGQGTAIHWHGIRQLNSNWQDGVAGVTQCPIKPGTSMSYTWQATQYGTSWYHSHYSLQYADGLAGPIVIHGPTSADYDEDLGPFMMADWYHNSAFSMNYRNPAPPRSVLINGHGKYTNATDWDPAQRMFKTAQFSCDSSDPRCYPELAKKYEVVVKKGKRYKLRILNASVDTHFTFWIDNHNFTIVSTDFVPIKPKHNQHSLNVGIGQRYDIIFEAKADLTEGTDFWFNIINCDKYCIGQPCPSTEKDSDCQNEANWSECRMGILRYDGTSKSRPTSSSKDPGSYGCRDEPAENLRPVVHRSIPLYDRPDIRSIQQFNVSLWRDNVTYWSLTNETFYINWTDPSLSVLRDHQRFPPQYSPIILNARKWHYFIIEGDWTKHDAGTHVPIPGAKHPIHLHGHDFLLLAQLQNKGDKYSDDVYQWDNPTRRDVALLPQNGTLVIAFQADNPGAWLMHCHIAWHASEGLALQFIEQPAEVYPMLERAGKALEYKNRCETWSDYYNSAAAEKQEDSGV